MAALMTPRWTRNRERGALGVAFGSPLFALCPLAPRANPTLPMTTRPRSSSAFGSGGG